MKQTLVQLREDHSNLTLLLNAVEREASVIAPGNSLDLNLLKGILAHFRNYVGNYHHPREDLIYGHLICHVPRFSSDIFALIDDHRKLAEHALPFEQALDQFDAGDPEKRKMVSQEARDFVAREREHLKAEEERFLPAAEQWLTKEEWAEVDRYPANDEALGLEEKAKAPLDGLLKLINATPGRMD